MILDYKGLRKRLGISQTELVEVLGVNQPTISALETRRKDSTQRHIDLLMKRYGDIVLRYVIEDGHPSAPVPPTTPEPTEAPAEPDTTTTKSEGPSDLKTLVSDLLAEIHTQNEVILQQHAEICEQNRRYHELVKLLTNRKNEDE